MTTPQPIPPKHLEIASNLLNRGKAIAPDRFPKPSRESAEGWAQALGRAFDMLPVGIWPEAVAVWSTDYATDRMATPREIRDAAYTVRDRWEAIPGKARLLADRRKERELEREQQIADGTFGQIRGYQPPAALTTGPARTPENVNPDQRRSWREIVAGFRSPPTA